MSREVNGGLDREPIELQPELSTTRPKPDLSTTYPVFLTASSLIVVWSLP